MFLVIEFLSSTVSLKILDVSFLSVHTGECLRGHLPGTMRNENHRHEKKKTLQHAYFAVFF